MFVFRKGNGENGELPPTDWISGAIPVWTRVPMKIGVSDLLMVSTGLLPDPGVVPANGTVWVAKVLEVPVFF